MSFLTSNGVAIPFDPDHFMAMADSTSLLSDAAALRARYEADGYLYLRGVLDRSAIFRMRRSYFAAFDPSYLRTGTDPVEGVFSGARPVGLPAHGVVGHPAYDFVRGADFAVLGSDPRLRQVAELVLDGQVEVLPRQIVRHFDRSGPAASRAHVDLRYLDHGSANLVTTWIPLGDCPVATGGLIYLEGSHRLSSEHLDALHTVTDRPDDDRPISHDLGWVSRQLGARWLWTDFRAGDLTLHSPQIVHASLDTSSDSMRLSADLRFLRHGEPADPRWLQPWAGDDGN
jgi:ectoine hydroxylase-related dioxygenase (phytanoyl-CoA dioxygenase family)